MTGTIVVSISVPAGSGGLTDVTVVTITSQINSGIQATAIDTTTVNHVPGLAFGPSRTRSAEPGEVVTYTHLLTNTGNGGDVFDLAYHSSQGWATVYPSSVSLGYQQTASIVVSVSVPAGSGGLADATVITATSRASNATRATVTDTTTVAITEYQIYLPLIMRNR